MSRRQPPEEHKSPALSAVCAHGAMEPPRRREDRVAELVWRLEEVHGHGDAEVARVAEAQRGIVAREQLLAAGLSPAAIKHRLRIGQLHVLYSGVYVFGRPRLEPLAAETAAAIHLKFRGVLSHRSAGHIWGLIDGDGPSIHVSAVASGVRPRRGLVVHRVTSLDSSDVRLARGLPVTSPARTVVDMAGFLELHELEAVVALALRRQLVTATAEVATALSRTPKAKGATELKQLLARGARPTLTRSKYERKLIQLLKRADLPMPLVNAMAEGHEVDLLWPERKLVVEFDGFAYHSDRQAFEQDRLRDQRLVAAGYRVIRITARQLDHTPEAVIARLAAALVH